VEVSRTKAELFWGEDTIHSLRDAFQKSIANAGDLNKDSRDDIIIGSLKEGMVWLMCNKVVHVCLLL
jgi:hypothetical protein